MTPSPREPTRKELEQEIQSFKEQVQRLDEGQQNLQSQLKESETNRVATEAKLNELKTEKTNLETGLKENEASREALRRDVQTAQDDRAKVEAALKELQAEKQTLAAKLQQAQAAQARIVQTVAADTNELSKAQAQIRDLQEENDRLRLALQQATNQPPKVSITKSAVPPLALFQAGALAYKSGEYPTASAAFRDSAGAQPASGTFQNLGLAEWQRGQPGLAILAWEQSLWLDSFNRAAHANLRFARKAAQVDVPELAWYEVISTWLPMNWWAWIGVASLWITVAATFLPGILRARRRGWHQAVAAASLTLFLLSIPAAFGIESRSRLGFVLQKDCPLRLTPTAESQLVTKLPAGEPVRLERSRGSFCLVRTSRSSGWVTRDQLGFVSQKL